MKDWKEDDGQNQSKSVLVSDTHLGKATKLSPFFHYYFFNTVTDLLMWGALSDDRSAL
jgi:hypothetical protein